MLKATTHIFILTIYGLTACQNNQNDTLTKNISGNIYALNETSKALEGTWILTDYIDSILKDKTIAKHSMYPILERIVSFTIHNDSLFSKGIIFKGSNAKITLTNDTLNQSRFPYMFHYNNESDQIEAIPLRLNSRTYFHRADKRKYTYRRATEKRLANILGNKYGILGVRSEDCFHQLFIDSLIAGEYKSIRNGQRLLLTNNNSPYSYSMSGFKQYNKYDIYDYLERRELDEENRFNSYDAIIFREHRGSYSEDDIRGKINMMAYNWRFSGDTLTLTEMRDTMRPNTRFSEHFPGTRKFIFIRTK